MRRKTNKRKKLVCIIILILLLLVVFTIYKLFFNKPSGKTVENKFSENVITTGEVKIYLLKDNNYVESGMIGKNVELSLENIDNKYFKIKDFEDYYIKYENVKDLENRTENND